LVIVVLDELCSRAGRRQWRPPWWTSMSGGFVAPGTDPAGNTEKLRSDGVTMKPFRPAITRGPNMRATDGLVFAHLPPRRY
jgi:hypothetical protein